MNDSNQWLNQYSKNITSQCGEDGILEKVLETIEERNNWSVEFGAWDGKHMSNTFNLVKNKGYSGVFIEGDTDKFTDLKKMFDHMKNVVLINTFVGFDEDAGLDTILKSKEIPLDFDILSIDIDGNDYHVWNAIKLYNPKVVVIEFNPTIPNEVEFVQPRDMKISQGSSLLSLNNLGKEKGYELVAVTKLNAIFVQSKYFGLFKIKDNSIQRLRMDSSHVTYIFNGYDGTVFIRGCGELTWHGIPYSEGQMQQLPKWLREYPGNSSPWKRKITLIFVGCKYLYRKKTFPPWKTIKEELARNFYKR